MSFQTEEILQQRHRWLPYVFVILGAFVSGYLISQQLQFQVITYGVFFFAAWLVFFVNSPVNALIFIVGAKTCTDRLNYPIFGSFSVNALLYCAVLGGGLACYMVERGRMRSNGAGRVYLLFLGYTFVLAFFTPIKSESLSAWVREGAMCALYLLFANLMTGQRSQKKYIFLVCLLGVVGVMISLLQRAGLYPSFDPSRFSGTFGHPNFFAYYLLIPTGFACGFFLLSPAFSARVFWLSLILLLSGGVLLTYTRGAWIAAAVMFLIIGVLSKRWWFPVVAILGMIGIYLVVPTVQERLYWIIDSPNVAAGTSGRSTIWLYSLPMIQENPWFGYGVNSFQIYSPLQVDAHNSYLKVIFETGVIGLVLYCLFFALNIRYAYQVWQRSPDAYERIFALGFLGCFFAFLVGGLWENLFLGQGTEWFIYSSAGIMAAAARRMKSEEAVVSSTKLHSPIPTVAHAR